MRFVEIGKDLEFTFDVVDKSSGWLVLPESFLNAVAEGEWDRWAEQHYKAGKFMVDDLAHYIEIAKKFQHDNFHKYEVYVVFCGGKLDKRIMDALDRRS